MATPNTSPLNYGDRCAVDFDNGERGKVTLYGTFRGWTFGDPNAASKGFIQYDTGSGGYAEVWGVRPLTAEEAAAEAAKLAADRIRYDF